MRQHIRNALIIAAATVPLLGMLVVNSVAQERQEGSSAANERDVVRAIRDYETACKFGTLQDRSVTLGLLLRTLQRVEGR
jgi:hypothetical protein